MLRHSERDMPAVLELQHFDPNLTVQTLTGAHDHFAALRSLRPGAGRINRAIAFQCYCVATDLSRAQLRPL